MNIIFTDPAKIENWNELILNFPSYSFFHSSDWAKLLQETYKFKPHYLVVEESGRIKAILPLMEINSLLTGRRAISLPFSDFCDPLIAKDISYKRIRNRMLEFCKISKFNSLELRDSEVHTEDSIIIPAGYQHILDLTSSEEQLFNNFSDNTRRNIRKAVKSQITFEINNTTSALEDFYNMNCYTRRRHGLPPQPYKFFKNFYDIVLSKNNGFIGISKFKDRTIAGALFLLIGKKALYKYGASLFEFQNFRPNNLLMWESIKYLKNNGFEELNFGRTEIENIGLRRFKLGWGCKEKILNYYRFELGKDHKINSLSKSINHKNISLNRFPIVLLKLIGRIIYKHIA